VVQDTELTSNKEGFDSPWDRHNLELITFSFNSF